MEGGEKLELANLIFAEIRKVWEQRGRREGEIDRELEVRRKRKKKEGREKEKRKWEERRRGGEEERRRGGEEERYIS